MREVSIKLESTNEGKVRLAVSHTGAWLSIEEMGVVSDILEKVCIVARDWEETAKRSELGVGALKKAAK